MTAAPPLHRPRDTGGAIVDLSIIFIALTAMVAWTWLKWPDPLIDFGRELYLAWQVSLGKALYRDVEHFNGPLSVWINAGVFRVFGVSLHAIVFANLAVLLAVTTLIYALARRAAGRLAATACGVAFAALFACVQFVEVGNYNFLTPYSHEATHGTALALLAIWLTVRFIDRDDRRSLVIAGCVLGLLWLTKAELFFAGAAAVMIGAMVVRSSVPRWRRAAMLVCPAIVIIAIAWGCLRIQLPARTALRGVCGNFWYLFNTDISQLPFYQQLRGSDAPGRNTVYAVVSAAVIGAMIFARRLNLSTGRPQSAAPALLVATAIPLALALTLGNAIPWPLALRGVPVVLAILFYRQFNRIRSDARPADIIRLMLLSFGWLVGAKILWAYQLSHYGFVLAMPGTLAVCAALASRERMDGELPDRHAAVPATPVGAAFALSCVVSFIAVHLLIYSHAFADKPLRVGESSDAFRTESENSRLAPRGAALMEFLPAARREIDAFERAAGRRAMLAAMPEGAMINFLLRRENPTPFVTLLPPEFLMFGADRIIGAYRTSPPDFIVIVPTNVQQYGSAGFARDYAAPLVAWADERYEAVETPQVRGYALTLMRRKATVNGMIQPR